MTSDLDYHCIQWLSVLRRHLGRKEQIDRINPANEKHKLGLNGSGTKNGVKQKYMLLDGDEHAGVVD